MLLSPLGQGRDVRRYSRCRSRKCSHACPRDRCDAEVVEGATSEATDRGTIARQGNVCCFRPRPVEASGVLNLVAKDSAVTGAPRR